MTINDQPSASLTSHAGHSYATVSAHNTSEGRVVYQRCVCGLWRIQRYIRGGAPVLEAVVDQRGPSATPAQLGVPAYASL